MLVVGGEAAGGWSAIMGRMQAVTFPSANDRVVSV